MSVGFICVLGLFVGSAQTVLAQASDQESILIRNVRLFDQAREADDVIVNILIKKGKLKLVSKDEIPAEEAELVLNAQEGVLLGTMDLGSEANFLIFDVDPRKHFEVLLDTATRARFAIHNGEIVKNTLWRPVRPEPETKKRRWLAYAPPPIALPMGYLDTKPWNSWESKYTNGIFLAAGVLDRQRWISQDGASEEQVGDLADYDGGEIRGFRLGAVGSFNFKRPWIYTIFAATNAFSKGFDRDEDEDISFLDYRLDIPVSDTMTMSVGKQKEPISLERLTSMVFLPMQERSSVSDGLLPSRNVGIVVNGSGLGRRMTWAAGAFNDWFDAGQSFGESATQYVGRLTALPFISEDESNLLHLGLGLRYSDAKEGVRYRTEPEFNKAPVFVDTDWLEAESSMTYNLEASWRKSRYWLHAEYMMTDVDSPTLGDPRFSGYHVTASWSASGEMRSYNKRSGLLNRLPIAQSVYQGGRGAWEFGIRWSDLDLSDRSIDGGEMQILSLGVNWWLNDIFNVNLNYRHITLDRFGIEGTSSGINTRILLILE